MDNKTENPILTEQNRAEDTAIENEEVPTQSQDDEAIDADTESTQSDTDFARMAEEDLAEIKRLFPSLSGISHLGEIERASRFGEMREAGFSVEEAFMATNYEKVFEAIVKRARISNGKSHLTSAVPAQSGASDSSMTSEEMRAAKEMFSSLSEKEIHSLYKRAIS